VSVCAPAGSTYELPLAVKHSSIVGTHDVRHGHSMADQQLGDGIMSRDAHCPYLTVRTVPYYGGRFRAVPTPLHSIGRTEDGTVLARSVM
jgi:hypothetical protein